MLYYVPRVSATSGTIHEHRITVWHRARTSTVTVNIHDLTICVFISPPDRPKKLSTYKAIYFVARIIL